MTRATDDITFLYCVGATKAATTWLHEVLTLHPQCRTHHLKEVHFWNTLEGDARLDRMKTLRRKIAFQKQKRDQALAEGDAIAAYDHDVAARDAQRLLQVMDGSNDPVAAYVDWMLDGAEDHKMVVDVTPAYSLLPAGVFQRMMDAHPAAHVLYILRDPLSRLWSHIRMNVSRGVNGSKNIAAIANDMLRAILAGEKGKQIVNRGDYASILPKLKQAVPADRLTIAFTEDLTADAGFDAFCDTFGLDRKPIPTDTAVHQGIKAKMADELVAPTLAFLRVQYDYVAEHFGPLPAAWQASLAKG